MKDVEAIPNNKRSSTSPSSTESVGGASKQTCPRRRTRTCTPKSNVTPRRPSSLDTVAMLSPAIVLDEDTSSLFAVSYLERLLLGARQLVNQESQLHGSKPAIMVINLDYRTVLSDLDQDSSGTDDETVEQVDEDIDRCKSKSDDTTDLATYYAEEKVERSSDKPRPTAVAISTVDFPISAE